MATTLTKIVHTNGTTNSIRLDKSTRLDEVREKLKGFGIISDSDSFLFGGAAVLLADESETTVEEILESGNIINIGAGKSQGLIEDGNIEDYRSFSLSQKNELFRKCQIFRGLSLIAGDGIKRSSKDLFEWNGLPDMTNPRINTQELSYYSFSKVTQELNLITSNKATLSLDVPYVKADAEYNLEKSKSAKSEKVTEYLLAKYIISKAIFNIDVNGLRPTADFVRAVNTAVCSNESEKDRMCELARTLNKWGMYIPREFTLGGALYSKEETEISDYSEAAKEKEAFSVSASAKFASISASAGYSQSTETDKSSSTSNKYKNISVVQIGGKAGKISNKDELGDSLDRASLWEIVDIAEFYPSLMLLNGARVDGTDPNLLSKCLKLMNGNYYHAAVTQLQPYVNIKNYATAIETLLSPW